MAGFGLTVGARRRRRTALRMAALLAALGLMATTPGLAGLGDATDAVAPAASAAPANNGNGNGPPDHAGGPPPHAPGPPPHAHGPPDRGDNGNGGDDPPANAIEPSENVHQPEVEGPIGDEGIRTGEPYATTLIPLPDGWIEEEYFFGGTAVAIDGRESDYRSRILIRRPVDPADFNGTAVLDWNNVTIPADRDTAWHPLHATIMERGFIYVSVAAQRLGVEISPLGLKQWDPVRYGSLDHPGDDWSFDIFSQAAEAILADGVLGELRPYLERRLAMGASQSATRLRTYINQVHEHALVFDGFKPQIIGVGSVRRDLVPTLWVNSGGEAGDTADADGGVGPLFRLWEIAGTAHTSYGSSEYNTQTILYAHSNGNAGSYDHDDGGAWGYQHDPGECLRANYNIAGYTWSAALVALDDWVRTGEAPPVHLYERDENGRVYDEHGNHVGGVRSPIMDVPIAAYYGGGAPPTGDPCGEVGGRMALSGWTRIFSADTLAALYESKDDYLARFAAATQDALEAGFILPEGAADLLRRAPLAAEILDRGDALLSIPGGP